VGARESSASASNPYCYAQNDAHSVYRRTACRIMSAIGSDFFSLKAHAGFQNSRQAEIPVRYGEELFMIVKFRRSKR